jgi:hypothetical protein
MNGQIRSDVTVRFWKATGWLFCGIVLGFGFSKYSVGQAFKAGYDHAFEKYAQHYPKQVKYFHEHRDRSCMAYWFGDKQSRVDEARRWMCQYTNREGALK